VVNQQQSTEQLKHLSAARAEALMVGRAQGGDCEAFTELVSLHQQTVQRWLIARCPPGIEPEDVAQQAFLIAWRDIKDYRGTGAFCSWVIGIAANLLRREHRQLQQQAQFQARLADLMLSGEEQHQEPRESEHLHRELEQLHACLRELDTTLERVVHLHYHQHRQVTSIASEMKRPTGTIKRQLHHARKLLFACIRRRLHQEQSA